MKHILSGIYRHGINRVFRGDKFGWYTRNSRKRKTRKWTRLKSAFKGRRTPKERKGRERNDIDILYWIQGKPKKYFKKVKNFFYFFEVNS